MIRAAQKRMALCNLCRSGVRVTTDAGADPMVIEQIVTRLDKKAASTEAPRLPESRAPPYQK